MTSREKELLHLLHKEVKPALGCTEPIAVALATAKAVELVSERVSLDRMTSQMKLHVYVSGNILKNGMGVGIPGTGMIGLRIAAALGAVCGRSEYGLEVLKDLNVNAIKRAKELVAEGNVCIDREGNCHKLYVKCVVEAEGHSAWCVIEDEHDRIVETGIDGEGEKRSQSEDTGGCEERETRDYHLTVKEIYEFAGNVDYEDIKFILEDRTLNLALAQEGLKGDYGLKVGKTIQANADTVFGNDFLSYAMALTAAASDARMAGCTLPAMSNSGSGNQGITASVPIVVFAKELQVSEETMYRALVISNLATIHIKEGIGRLSAYCGAVGAGCGCGAGIAYLYGDGQKEGEHAIVNGLAIVSGMICDGAKASCAAKIASSVDAGILGYFMYKNGQQFIGGDGIVKKGVENTIRCVGKLASEGMLETDREIVHLMIHG